MSKQSAFIFPGPDKLCGWRHLLALGVGIVRVSVIDGHRCGSVRLANVHKLGAEIRYLTNLRNLRELFRYPSPENPGGRQSRAKISVGSFCFLFVFLSCLFFLNHILIPIHLLHNDAA